MKFDYYSASVKVPAEVMMRAFENRFPYAQVEQMRPMVRYDDAFKCSFENRRVFDINFQRSTGSTLLTTSGQFCPDVVDHLRSVHPVHGVSRIDACVDFTGETVFDQINAVMVDIALDKGLKLAKDGDWDRSFGRTTYIGAPKSPVRVRVYEKGVQQFQEAAALKLPLDDDFDITRSRFEAQLRPKSSDKALVSTYSPSDVIAHSEWTRYAYGLIAGCDLAPTLKATISRTTQEQKEIALITQYGRTLMNRLDLEGGDLNAFGAHLLRLFHEQQAFQRQRSYLARFKMASPT